MRVRSPRLASHCKDFAFSLYQTEGHQRALREGVAGSEVVRQGDQ